MAHDVMELWRNEQAQGLNFATEAYQELLPLLKALSEVGRHPLGASHAASNGVQLATLARWVASAWLSLLPQPRRPVPGCGGVPALCGILLGLGRQRRCLAIYLGMSPGHLHLPAPAPMDVPAADNTPCWASTGAFRRCARSWQCRAHKNEPTCCFLSPCAVGRGACFVA